MAYDVDLHSAAYIPRHAAGPGIAPCPLNRDHQTVRFELAAETDEGLEHVQCRLRRGLPGDGRLDDVGLVRAVDQALPGKLLQRAVGGTQEQLRPWFSVLIPSAIRRSPCGLTHRMWGKSVLESVQQIVCLFQAAVSVPVRAENTQSPTSVAPPAFTR